ncbi:MAG: DUF1194 domain-containing protein, partial [Pseudomonadota bacterium]
VFFWAASSVASAAYSRETRSVHLELVLAVDASSSVDDAEYALQLAGYVNAFRDRDVISAIEALAPRGIAVTYVEWSSRRQQVQSVGWTPVFNEASSRSFANAIEQTANTLKGSGTAIGEAMLFSSDLFRKNRFDGDRRIIDISADDRYNAGSAPSYARDIVVKNGIVINGLVIDKTGFLASYFRDNVIGGSGSFVISANSYLDFATSIKLKLLRELNPNRPVAGLRHQ